jgi:hypothetical protein
MKSLDYLTSVHKPVRTTLFSARYSGLKTEPPSANVLMFQITFTRVLCNLSVFAFRNLTGPYPYRLAIYRRNVKDMKQRLKIKVCSEDLAGAC